MKRDVIGQRLERPIRAQRWTPPKNFGRWRLRWTQPLGRKFDFISLNQETIHCMFKKTIDYKYHAFDKKKPSTNNAWHLVKLVACCVNVRLLFFFPGRSQQEVKQRRKKSRSRISFPSRVFSFLFVIHRQHHRWSSAIHQDRHQHHHDHHQKCNFFKTKVGACVFQRSVKYVQQTREKRQKKLAKIAKLKGKGAGLVCVCANGEGQRKRYEICP